MTTVTTLPRGGPWTVADLAELPDDGHQHQLIDGALIVVPSPVPDHQRASRSVFLLLHDSCPEDLEVFFAPFDVILGTDTSLQPDLLVTRPEDVGPHNLQVPPVLAVEVLSPSTRSVDLVLKKDRLQRAGCPSYWVLDPRDVRFLAWELDAGRYVEVADVSGEQTWQADRPFPVEVCPARLLGR